MVDLTSFCTHLLLFMVASQVSGNGRLIEPPSRSSMWRFGFPTAVNYNDNILNCGGLYIQWYVNQGKCGVCGDPWNQILPRNNEAGGLYGKGIITRTYSDSQVIDVSVDITANHNGWFEFRLCPHNDPSTPVTHDCLDQHLLQFATNGSQTRYHIGTGIGIVNIKLKLPHGVTCTQCVLQWKWHTGNSFGTDESGSCIGCGLEQEEFYGCADIAITASNSNLLSSSTMSTAKMHEPIVNYLSSQQQSITSSFQVTQQVTRATTTKCRAINEWAGVTMLDYYCSEQCLMGNCPSLYCSCFELMMSSTVNPLPLSVISSFAPDQTTNPVKCFAINSWRGVENLDIWCSDNCLVGQCPEEFCQCGSAVPVSQSQETTNVQTTFTVVASTDVSLHSKSFLQKCHATAEWAGQPQLDQWCSETCSLYECDLLICICDPLAPGMDAILMTCHAINGWSGDPALNDWCQTNCNNGLCPQDYCACERLVSSPGTSFGSSQQTRMFPSDSTISNVTKLSQPDCHAINAWLGVAELDQWCRQQCAEDNCPSSICFCIP